MRQPIAAFVLLAALSSASCSREAPIDPPSDPAPPWQLRDIEKDIQDYFGHRLKNVRLLAWRLAISCRIDGYGVGYAEQVLLAAESAGTAESGPEWLLIPAHLSGGEWIVDNNDGCDHCQPGDHTLYLKKPPRAEDVQALVETWWVKFATLSDEQMVASGVDTESWRALFGKAPVLVFAPKNPPLPTCYGAKRSE